MTVAEAAVAKAMAAEMESVSAEVASRGLTGGHLAA
jgi:hypothetical protein